jgi:hypothetical protein
VSDDATLFDLDVRRSIILGAYIHRWGIPDFRVKTQRQDHIAEVYSFPPRRGGPVHRFATVGVSAATRADGKRADWELLMVLPGSLAGASTNEVASFIFDVMAYSYRADVNFSPGQTIPETPLAPKAWEPRALLLDEPRGETEGLSSTHVGHQHVKLIWLVPIYGDELALIEEQGLREFYRRERDSEWSLADPDRPSIAAPSSS